MMNSRCNKIFRQHITLQKKFTSSSKYWLILSISPFNTFKPSEGWNNVETSNMDESEFKSWKFLSFCTLIIQDITPESCKIKVNKYSLTIIHIYLPVGHRTHISAHDWHQQLQLCFLSSLSELEKLSFRDISYGSLGSKCGNFFVSSPGELVAVDKHDGEATPLAEVFKSNWSLLASLLWLRETESFDFSPGLGDILVCSLFWRQDWEHLPHRPFRTGFWVHPLVVIVISFVPTNHVAVRPPSNIKSAVGCLKK